jgi:hypothetical protein
LGDRSFDVRRRAAAGLVAVGPAALPGLGRAAGSDDPEVARRARDCAAAIRSAFDPALASAVVRQVARDAPAGSADVLMQLLPHAEDVLALEVRSALCELARRDPAVREMIGPRLAAWQSEPGRRLYPRGVKVARRALIRFEPSDDAARVHRIDLTGVQFFNCLDDALFARPAAE